MNNPKRTPGNFAIVLLLLTGMFCLYWSSSSLAHYFWSSENIFASRRQSHTVDAPVDELESALAKASMGNKTVILAIINKAYAEQDISGDTTVFDLFLSSFWLGEGTRSLLDHLLIVAVDRTAYDRCRFLRLNCFRLETNGVDFEGEKFFMSDDFIKMMWRRTLFLWKFSNQDTDVMWLRNPFTRLRNNTEEDLQISTDRYLGNPWSERHDINTGFYFIRSNKKTISLFEKWYDKKDSSTGQKDQDVLQDFIRHGIIRRLDLKVRFMDTFYFSGFCQDSKDFRAVTTVHANCCRGIAAKVADLKAVLLDWKRYKKFESSKSLEANLTTNVAWSEHYECQKSWK